MLPLITAYLAGLVDLVRHHIYVGLADHTKAVLQHGTGLYLADLQRLSMDMFHQQVQRCSYSRKGTAAQPQQKLAVQQLRLVCKSRQSCLQPVSCSGQGSASGSLCLEASP